MASDPKALEEFKGEKAILSSDRIELVATEIVAESDGLLWPDEFMEGIIKPLSYALNRGMKTRNLHPDSPRLLHFKAGTHPEKGPAVEVSMSQWGSLLTRKGEEDAER